jgi:hypothetical protein
VYQWREGAVYMVLDLSLLLRRSLFRLHPADKLVRDFGSMNYEKG